MIDIQVCIHSHFLAWGIANKFPELLVSHVNARYFPVIELDK
jgi:hypothetical protein